MFDIDDYTRPQKAGSALFDIDDMVDSLSSDEEKSEEDRESPGFIGSIKGGVKKIQGLGYGALALAPEFMTKYPLSPAAGAVKFLLPEETKEAVGQFGVEGYKRKMEEAEEFAPTVRMRDLGEHPEKIGTWVVETAGDLIPSMAEAAIGGLIGSLIAPGPGTAIGAFTAKTILKKGIEKAVKKGLTTELGKKLGARELKKQVTAGALKKLGASAGMFGTVAQMEAGGNYAELLTEHGVKAPMTSLITGTAAAALEFLGGNSRILRKMFGGKTQRAISTAIRKKQGGYLKRLAGEIIKNPPAEALQEAGQEVLSVLNIVANTDEKLFTEENLWQIAESAGAGALGGGMGVPVQAMGAQAQQGMTEPPSTEQERINLFANMLTQGVPVEELRDKANPREIETLKTLLPDKATDLDALIQGVETPTEAVKTLQDAVMAGPGEERAKIVAQMPEIIQSHSVELDQRRKKREIEEFNARSQQPKRVVDETILQKVREELEAKEFAKKPTPEIIQPETFMGAREGELEVPEPDFIDRARARLEQKPEKAAEKPEIEVAPLEEAEKETKPKGEEPLRDYAKKLTESGEVKSVSLVGSSVKGKGKDVDILYDLGKLNLPEDSGKAAETLTSHIEGMKSVIDTDSYDTFLKADDRYFHISSGAGREIIENNEYAVAQKGKPKSVLAEYPDLVTKDVSAPKGKKPEVMPTEMTDEEARQTYEVAQKNLDKVRPTIIEDKGLVKSPNVVLMNVRTLGGKNPTKIGAPYNGTKEDALRVAKALRLYASEEYDASMRDSEMFATDTESNPAFAFTQGKGETLIHEVGKPKQPPAKAEKGETITVYRGVTGKEGDRFLVSTDKNVAKSHSKIVVEAQVKKSDITSGPEEVAFYDGNVPEDKIGSIEGVVDRDKLVPTETTPTETKTKKEEVVWRAEKGSPRGDIKGLKTLGKGTYVSSNKEIASVYGEPEPYVIVGNPNLISTNDNRYIQIRNAVERIFTGKSKDEFEKVVGETVKASGYDGVIGEGLEGTVIFDDKFLKKQQVAKESTAPSATAKFNDISEVPRPLTGYPGNKATMLTKGAYDHMLPKDMPFKRVVEPFGGSGLLGNAINYKLKAPRILNDLDPEVYNFHITAKNKNNELIAKLFQYDDELKELKQLYPKGGTIAHDAIRTWWKSHETKNVGLETTEGAAWFAVKNNGGTSLMGKGQHLVRGKTAKKKHSWTFKKNTIPHQITEIREHGKVLQDIEITNKDGRQTVRDTKEGDLVLLDPPYVAGEGKGKVLEYKKGKDLSSLEGAIEFIQNDLKNANQRGASKIYTNNAHPEIIKALTNIGLQVKIVEVRSQNVGGKAGTRKEVIAWDVVRQDSPVGSREDSKGSIQGLKQRGDVDISGRARSTEMAPPDESSKEIPTKPRVKPKPQYSTGKSPIPLSDLSKKSLAAIPGVQKVTGNPKYGFRLHFAGNRSVAIKSVTLEGDNAYIVGTRRRIKGKYVDGQITIAKDVGDRYTITHELEHWMEDVGIIDLKERRALNKAIGNRKAGPEDRAVFVEKAMMERDKHKGVIGDILQKIQDFLDAVVNVFRATPTARKVLRDIESGKIFDKKTDPHGIFEFAQPAYQTTAWHGQTKAGQPITEFDPEMVGTGLGLGLGWGVYISELKGVGRTYADIPIRNILIYNGEQFTKDELIDKIRSEYGDELGAFAGHLGFSIAWDFDNGFIGDDLAKQVFRVVKDQGSPVSETRLKSIIEEISEGLERNDVRPGWNIRPKGSIRVENKMPKSDQMLLFDIQGRMGWYSEKVDAEAKVKEQLRQTVSAQKSHIKSGYNVEKAQKILSDAQRMLEMFDEYELQAKYQKPPRNLYEVSLGKDLDDMVWLEWDKKPSDDLLKKVGMEKPPFPKWKRETARLTGKDKWLLDGWGQVRIDDNGWYDYYDRNTFRGSAKNLEDAKKSVEEYVYVPPGFKRGEEVYRALIKEHGSDRKASEFLSRAGIDGVKAPVGYFGGNQTEGKFNYVIFDPSKVKIEKHEQFSAGEDQAMSKIPPVPQSAIDKAVEWYRSGGHLSILQIAKAIRGVKLSDVQLKRIIEDHGELEKDLASRNEKIKNSPNAKRKQRYTESRDSFYAGLWLQDNIIEPMEKELAEKLRDGYVRGGMEFLDADRKAYADIRIFHSKKMPPKATLSDTIKKIKETINTMVEEKKKSDYKKEASKRVVDLSKIKDTQYSYEGQLDQATSAIKNLPAFREWFGKSQVTDSEGEPLVVYHGTNEAFEAFNLETWGDTGGEASSGFFFTSDPVEASGYAGEGGGNVIPAFLSLQNPLVLPYEQHNINDVIEADSQVAKLLKQSQGLVSRLRKRDGLILQNIGGKSRSLYVAFHPTQIKSIFNETWNPKDPRISYSAEEENLDQWAARMAEKYIKADKDLQGAFKKLKTDPGPRTIDAKEARSLVKVFKERFGDYSDRDMKWYSRAFGLPYWLAKKYPSMKEMVATEVDASEERSTELFRDYNESDLGAIQESLPKNKKALEQFKKIIWKFEGRRFSKKYVPTDWYKDIKDDEDIRINPKHYTEVESYLTKQGYDPEAIHAFITVRKKLDEKFVDIDKTLRVEKLDPTLIEEYRATINKIHNYFPHRRTGNSYVMVVDLQATDPEAKVKYREHYNKFKNRLVSVDKKAKSRAKDWLQSEIDKGHLEGDAKRYEIRAGAVKQLPDEVFFQIPIDAMQQLMSVTGRTLERKRVKYEAERLARKEGIPMDKATEIMQKRLRIDIEDAISKAFSDVLKSRGFGRHAIHRKGIPGHETEDVFGILFDYIAGYAGFKTKITRARKHHETLKKIQSKVKPEEFKYCMKYAQDMLANQDKVDRAVDTIRGLFFVKYLGFVVKSGFVNLSQNAVMAAPVLSQYVKGGPLKAERVLGKAMKDVVAGLVSRAAWTGKEVRYKRLTADEQKALHEFTEKGASMDLYLRELKGNMPGTGWMKYYKKAIDHAGIFMRVAEKFNRASTGLAAYRIAKQKGMIESEALEWAKERIYDSHFLYGKMNLPSTMRGGTAAKYARSAYTFRTFTHNYLNGMAHLVTNQGREGKLAFARSLRNLFLMGGLVSMPFFKAFSEALMWAIGDDDEDLLTKMRSWMPHEWMKDILTYGLPGVAGADLTGSLSIEVPRNYKDILGVPYSTGEDIVNTIKSLKAGQKFRALSETPFTPLVARNAMRGFELFTSGQRTRSGQDINLFGKEGARKITTKEAISKSLLGLQPSSVSSGYKAYQATRKMQESLQDRKSRWANRYVNAMRRDDKNGMKKVENEVNEWNKKAKKEGMSYRVIDIRKAIKYRLRPGSKSIPKSLRQKAKQIAGEWGG